MVAGRAVGQGRGRSDGANGGDERVMLLGHIDLVSRDLVRGWAADTDRPYGTIEVAIFVGGRLVGLARADQARDDLKDSASLGSGLHGIAYRFDPPLSPEQDHDVVVRFAEGGKMLGQWRVPREPDPPAAPEPPLAKDAAAALAVAAPLPARPAVSGALPGHTTISFVDECTRERIKGWAASEARPDEVFDISIFVDGRKVAQVPANIPREDLAKTGRYGDGARGFFHAFDPPLPDGRDVRVTAIYARTGVLVNDGDLRLVGDRVERIERPPPLSEGEPRLLPMPVEPRPLFDFLGLHDGAEELSRLLARLDFAAVTPEQVHHAVFGAYPDSVDDVLAWGTYYARDHLHQLLLSEPFQRRLIPLFLRAHPEKRRLIFVHIPKCAGTDLTFHFRARYPSLDRSLTDPDWTTKPDMLRRLARVVAHTRVSDSIFVHGHINLGEHIAEGLIRPTDRVFTVLREPFGIAISQINYVLTRFDEDIATGRPGPDTAEWVRAMRLGSLPKRMSDDFVKRVTNAALRNESLILPNSLISWLGGQGPQAVLDRLVRHNVEVTDMARYNTWLRQAWGIEAATRWNESKKFVAIDDLTTDDVTYLNRITAEDRRFYRAIQDTFDATGKLSLSGNDLRGIVVGDR